MHFCFTESWLQRSGSPDSGAPSPASRGHILTWGEGSLSPGDLELYYYTGLLIQESLSSRT